VPTGKRWAPWCAAFVVVAACGGAADETPPAASPPPAPPRVAAVEDSTPPDTGSTLDLSREVFAYRGSGRDPFVSLLKSGGVRPLPQDLRVVGITFDPRYPQRSVAVLHDITDLRRFTVRPGDVVGRVRVVEVRAAEVIAVVQEFGVDRQVVLPLRRRQEASQ
jgi:hypothetical protein